MGRNETSVEADLRSADPRHRPRFLPWKRDRARFTLIRPHLINTSPRLNFPVDEWTTSGRSWWGNSCTMYGIDERTNAGLPCLLCCSRFASGDVVYLVYVSARLPGLRESVCGLLLPLARVKLRDLASSRRRVRLHLKRRSSRAWGKKKHVPFGVCTCEIKVESGHNVSFSFPPSWV